jgi:hypothetical protein
LVSLEDGGDRTPAAGQGPADSRTHACGGPQAGWTRAAGADTLLLLHVQPGARRSAVVGPLGGRLKIAVRAPAIEGRANEALLLFLAEAIQVRPRQLTLVAGAAGRLKTVRVEAARPEEVARRLLATGEGG